LVTRYDDVAEVLSSPDFVSDPALAGHPTGPVRPLTRLLTTIDPPEHTRQRAAARSAFTAKAVEARRPRIEELADGLLDRVAARGVMELMDDYAFPLPLVVVAEILGLAPEHQETFRRWSRVVIDCDFAPTDAETECRRRVAQEEIVDYLRAVLVEKRSRPDGTLIAEIVHSDLAELEQIGLVWLLLADGYEGVACLIGNGVLGLLLHPGEWERLRASPSLVGPAVEELFRYGGPASTVVRYARRDVDLRGRRIPRGDAVTLVLSSANRDEGRFEDPDRLDVGRHGAARHLAFGKGVHYCIGAGLARLECTVAVATLARRLPGLRLAVPVEELEWRPSLMLRGLRTLPLAF
jgi:cytochrome P450